MANVLTPSQQNALAAAAGNPALLELLESLINTVQATQTVTNTSGKNVPPRCNATVSYLAGNYIVQILNPGGSSPLSQIQAAQQTQGASEATTLQSVTPILHQIRCATSPAFGVNDNVQVFGGDTGSTQTYWTLTNLGSGNFYFQIRDSYDGVNWNNWTNANGGQPITNLPSEVTLESATNMDWALFTLPGGQLMAVGQGFAPDGGSFSMPDSLYSSAMAAIAAPNGFTQIGVQCSYIANSDVSIQIPANPASIGIPDYPVLVSLKYANDSTPPVLWSGSANLFGIAWDPAGKNVTQYVGTDNSFWVVFTLPGGAQLAFGQGRNANGSLIEIPAALSWVSGKLISVCSPHGDPGSNLPTQGIYACGLVQSGNGYKAVCEYESGTNPIWGGHANWLAVASNLPAVSVAGEPWYVINLASGHAIAFWAGSVASGSTVTLPDGFTQQNSLQFASPGSFTNAGTNLMHGVHACTLEDGLATLIYTDGQGNTWGGDINGMIFCWK